MKLIEFLKFQMRLIIFFCSFCVHYVNTTLGTAVNVNHQFLPRKIITPLLDNRRAKSTEHIKIPAGENNSKIATDLTKRSKSFPIIGAIKNDFGTPIIKMDNRKSKNELEERKIFWKSIGYWKNNTAQHHQKKKEEEEEQREKKNDEPLAVTKFREYLRIKTEQPNPDYKKSRDFLFNYAAEIGLPAWEYECVPGKIFVGMTFAGSDPTLPSLLLYSHSDVVPTMPSKWTHPPYDAHKDAQGNIYARGAQDMKSVGVQYVEAFRLLLQANGRKPFLRTVHILWGPDEEIGGHDGMDKFVKTDKFRSLNVGFALDEGLASATDVYRVFNGERAVWWLKVVCRGAPGHGSLFIEDTAGPKLNSILNSFNEYRESQYRKLKELNLHLGDVTSVNLTKIEGGVQHNVIPAKYTVYFDIRVTPTDNYEELEAMFGEWCRKAGPNVTYEFAYKSISNNVTSVDSAVSEWWRELSQVFAEEKCKISIEIFTGGTDSRYLRQTGIPAIGFSPMINTPVLLHDHNEFLNERVFMNGVKLYSKIIPRLANIKAKN